MVAPQFAAPCSGTMCPSTTQRSLLSEFLSICGMRSPHFERSSRLVQTSGCSWTWSSTLMNQVFTAILLQSTSIGGEAEQATNEKVSQSVGQGSRRLPKLDNPIEPERI